jgi:hypothetical protein
MALRTLQLVRDGENGSDRATGKRPAGPKLSLAC